MVDIAASCSEPAEHVQFRMESKTALENVQARTTRHWSGTEETEAGMIDVAFTYYKAGIRPPGKCENK